MIVNGQPTAALSGATTDVRDPATGELVDVVPRAGVEETRRAIEAAAAAFAAWSGLGAHRRSQILMRAAARVRENLDKSRSF